MKLCGCVLLLTKEGTETSQARVIKEVSVCNASARFVAGVRAVTRPSGQQGQDLIIDCFCLLSYVFQPQSSRFPFLPFSLIPIPTNEFPRPLG